MTEYRHLQPMYQQYAHLGIEERVAWIRADRWLETADARAALARLEDLLSYPPRDRMPCLLLYGDTGMGKTKIIRKFLRDHQPSFDRGTGVTTMPVVAMQMPAEPVERDIYGELLNAMGAPGPAGDATFRLKNTCRTLMRKMGVRMLIIDEIHAMLTGTYRQQRIFLNVIRFLANDLKVPLICSGTDLARQALLTDPQLAERFEAFHLKRWSNTQQLAQLLASLGSILPLREPSQLGSAAVRRKVLDMTDGVTVRIFRLIETVAVEAVRTGAEAIKLDSFDGDNLVLPLVAMARRSERRLQRQAS
ncbi:transposase [Rhizobium sp. WYCCWR10014]|jgi:replication-associated recombination protein RarA|uniref:TniB family NTP-binding protein n=1 Tax=Rhizobium TaxID=379 RepID=UPI0007E3EC6A|nr:MULTISPECIES: TniB family NTP-binding protein [Rhizobium]OAV50579.1 transposase [Rhizobium sp. WYCCWR10014]QIO70327.1 AAA family ATPase [Rhizobium leguminosarum bv. trifolii]